MTDVFQHGDWVHVTVRAEVIGDSFRVEDRRDSSQRVWYVSSNGPAVVKVERAPQPLPTSLGAVIRATLGGDQVVAARVTRLPDHDRPWSVLSWGSYHSNDEFADVEVLFAGIEVSS